jgi:hypothetical protein
MRFVEVKSAEQQGRLMQHRTRFADAATDPGNQSLRAHLAWLRALM